MKRENEIVVLDIQTRLELTGTEFEPRLELTGTEFEPRLELTGTEFEPRLELTGTEFELRLELTGTEFEPRLELTGTEFELRLELTGTEFEPRLEFTGKDVIGVSDLKIERPNSLCSLGSLDEDTDFCETTQCTQSPLYHLHLDHPLHTSFHQYSPLQHPTLHHRPLNSKRSPFPPLSPQSTSLRSPL
ncbi:hypothetical protein CHS0354_000947 [Potamilus streckersoni]|uniref:Uncharacterized protein n=1 Tax=Potamilus streckersoni TaxID=2493646 RepID=A0AAE0W0Z6_9BIVA|nr:hypothetical protein CHS0354_000947 [Potamilus streckersoni]